MNTLRKNNNTILNWSDYFVIRETDNFSSKYLFYLVANKSIFKTWCFIIIFLEVPIHGLIQLHVKYICIYILYSKLK